MRLLGYVGTAMKSESLIHAHNISVVKGGKHILKDVSVSIEKNSFKTIIGPNGAGKTMLLHTLLGIEREISGSITRKKNLSIGYVPQHLQVSKDIPLRVVDMLRLYRRPLDVHNNPVIQTFQIDPILNKQMHTLSGGEHQRVLLARALLNNPELLILDEPDQNLDVGGKIALYDIIRSIYQNYGCAILMVSHDIHFVVSSTQEVYCLNNVVCCSGSPQAVKDSREFADLFGQEIAETFAVYHHSIPQHTERETINK